MDKTERLLRMMEHPEQYSDAQWQELLSDEECRELHEVMRLSASAFEAEDAKQKIANGIKEEEWQKFLLRQANQFEREAKHFKNLEFRTKLLQLAAAFIGLLLLSGIAYAAVQIASHHQQSEASLAADTTAVANSQLSAKNSQLPSDTIAQPIVYENAELATILNEMATFYQVEPVYKNEASKHIRLYFTWDKHSSIDNIVDTFNKFERIHITRENKKLIVE